VSARPTKLKGNSETREASVVENYEIAPAYRGDVAASRTEAGAVGAIGHPTADAEDRTLDEFPAQPVSKFLSTAENKEVMVECYKGRVLDLS